MSLYLGTAPIAVNSSSREIGEIIQSTIPLSDAGLHLLDGSLISGSGSYGAFVTYIAGLVSNYPDLFTTEANWQTAVTTYGVCGKFVYDSVNNTVRLPRITGFTEATIDPTTLGNLTTAGLPNITSSTSWRFGVQSGQSFSPYHIPSATNTTAYMLATDGYYSGEAVPLNGVDASLSSPIYGNSSTVQPQSIKVLYYIVIATSAKTNIQVDIDNIATDLNGKADVGLSNVNSSGKSLAGGWSMPSSRYIDLNWNTQTSYTLPANGMVIAHGRSSGTDCWMSSGIYDNNDTWMFAVEVRGASGTLLTWATPMLKAGWKINIDAHNLSSKEAFRFIYAQGDN